MKKSLNIVTGSLTVIILLFQAGCGSTEKFTYSTWDKNNDESLTTDEFAEVFKKHYASEWIAGEDTLPFNSTEFLKASFALWNADGNDYIDRDEWEYVNDYYFNKYQFEDFEQLDSDENNQVSYNEFSKHIKDNGLFDDWDMDGNSKISEDELAMGLFNAYDFDETGYLEKGEFNTFASYYAEL